MLGYEELNAIIEASTVGVDSKSRQALEEAFQRDQKTWEEAGFDPDGVMKTLLGIAQPVANEYITALLTGNLNDLTPASVLTNHLTTAVCGFNLAVAAMQRMAMDEHFNMFVIGGGPPEGTTKGGD